MASKPLPEHSDTRVDQSLLEQVLTEAGEIALSFFRSDNEVWMKAGNSPVSEADHAVNDFLQKRLMEARPNYGWISEETDDSHSRSDNSRVFVVDPIDGTRGFLAGRSEWCVSVAVVENSRPTVGVLRAPKLGLTYSATHMTSSLLNGSPLLVPGNKEIQTLAGSKKLNEIMRDTLGPAYHIGDYIPSLAMRVAYVASGQLDLAVARSGAHEWDLAAADLILSQAGGVLLDAAGRKLTYNQRNLRAPALLASSRDNEKQARKLAKSAGILH